MPPLLHDDPAPDTVALTDDRRDDVVEAATAEQAIAEVHRRHGRAARIVRAEKVLRGGIGGFFAKELVQLTVDPQAAPHADRNPLVQAMAGGADDGPPGETFGEMLDRRAAEKRGEAAPTAEAAGVGRAVDALARETDDRERSFGVSLRAALAAEEEPSDPPPTSHAPPAPSASSVSVPATPRRGAASLLDDVGAGHGATRLAAVAEHVDAPRPATPDPAALAAARPLSAAADVTVPVPVPAPHAARTLELADLGVAIPAAPPRDLPGRDPLPSRHEALRQLRACAHQHELRAAQRPPPRRRQVRADHPARVESASSSTTVRAPQPVSSGPWSADALARAGLPTSVVAATVARRPDDDIGWLTAVARAIEPLCRPLGADAEVVVGPHADRIASHVGALIVSLDDRAAPRGSCALSTGRTSEARRWLAEERRGRPLHLVVGGAGWRDWLFESPAVVSWTDDDDLAAALEVAARFDTTLGWRLGGDGPRRVSPVDVAVAVRARVVGS